MKKLMMFTAAAALAVAPTAAYAGDDDGSVDLVRGAMEIACYILGLDYACRWLAENPPAPSEPAPGDG